MRIWLSAKAPKKKRHFHQLFRFRVLVWTIGNSSDYSVNAKGNQLAINKLRQGFELGATVKQIQVASGQRETQTRDPWIESPTRRLLGHAAGNLKGTIQGGDLSISRSDNEQR